MIRTGVHDFQDSLRALSGPAISFVMIYGLTWGAVLLNRMAEAQIVSAVFHPMASDEATKIVG